MSEKYQPGQAAYQTPQHSGYNPGQPQPAHMQQPSFQPSMGYPQHPGYSPQPSQMPGYSPQPSQTPGYSPQPGYASQPSFTPQGYQPGLNQQQPLAQPGMSVGGGNRNAKGLRMNAQGERDWSNGLCDCCEDCGTCIVSWCFPCFVYGQNKSRLDHLERNGYPHPSGGDAVGGDCCLHCVLAGCGLACILQSGTRGQIRNRYRIGGDSCGDCMTSWCCPFCALVQESREIEEEERSFAGAPQKH